MSLVTASHISVINHHVDAEQLSLRVMRATVLLSHLALLVTLAVCLASSDDSAVNRQAPTRRPTRHQIKDDHNNLS